MKDRRKKLIIIMSVVLAVLIVIGIVIGVTQAKKQKELEEQGILYQDDAEAVGVWDEEEFIDESEGVASDDGEGLEVVDVDTASAEDNTSGKNSNGSKDDKSSDNKNSSNTGNSGNTGSSDKNTTSGNKDNNNKGNNSSGNSNSGNNSTGNTGNSGSGSSDKTPSKVPEPGKGTYEQYMAMTPAQQQKYFESFDSENDFFTWYRKAKAEYDKKNDKTEISGGSIDIGDYMD